MCLEVDGFRECIKDESNIGDEIICDTATKILVARSSNERLRRKGYIRGLSENYSGFRFSNSIRFIPFPASVPLRVRAGRSPAVSFL